MTSLAARLATSALPAMRAVGAALILAGSVAAAHGQATIADCEKIQAADAYNQCLAKFGPTSKVKSLQPERPGDVKNSSEEAAASAGRPKSSAARTPVASRHGKRGHGVRASRHGAVHHAGRGGAHARKRATFTVRRRR